MRHWKIYRSESRLKESKRGKESLPIVVSIGTFLPVRPASFSAIPRQALRKPLQISIF
jgi:hypothetical protein